MKYLLLKTKRQSADNGENDKEYPRVKSLFSSRPNNKINMENKEICPICGNEKEEPDSCEVCNDWKMD
jgi:hypothetical protein